jgi:membrane protein implicated in regulation of membrane protease activity
MNEMFYWLSAGLLCLLLEMGHPGLFLFVSLACGAFAASIMAFMGFEMWIQVVIALAVSGVSATILTLWLKKSLVHVPKGHHTNVYALIGKEGVVTASIDAHTIGKVKVGGEVWSARGVHNVAIAQGRRIKVVQVSGSHLLVQEYEL